MKHTQILSWLLLLALAAGLAACSSGNIRPAPGEAASPGSFDLVIQAYDSGQFIVAGGVASPDVLDGHLAYLQSQGHLPARVLLENGDESRVLGAHLKAYARLQAKYGFQAWVEHDGKMEPLHPAGSAPGS